MFKKYGTPEKAETVDSEVENHIAKVGKALDDQTEEERELLWQEIEENNGNN